MKLPVVRSSYVQVGDIRTHFLEAGEGPPLILLHSGEFGACAEVTWEFNIAALAQTYHVYAPDFLGFGKTSKWFNFENMWAARVEHIRRFLELQGIEKAHFAGSSMGAGMLLVVASMEKPLWPLNKIVVANGGGEHLNNEARHVLTSYDCSREHMRKMVQVLFHNPNIRNDEHYIERRYQLSLEPGAWECTAAPRFRSPVGAVRAGALPMDYEKIKSDTLLIYGARDTLRAPDFGESLHGRIPGSTLQLFHESGHFPQIDEAEKFNRVVLQFLR